MTIIRWSIYVDFLCGFMPKMVKMIKTGLVKKKVGINLWGKFRVMILKRLCMPWIKSENPLEKEKERWFFSLFKMSRNRHCREEELYTGRNFVRFFLTENEAANNKPGGWKPSRVMLQRRTSSGTTFDYGQSSGMSVQDSFKLEREKTEFLPVRERIGNRAW